MPPIVKSQSEGDCRLRRGAVVVVAYTRSMITIANCAQRTGHLWIRETTIRLSRITILGECVLILTTIRTGDLNSTISM